MRAHRHRLLCVQEGGECELELVIHHELLQPQAPEQPKALPGVSSSLPGCCCSACISMRPSDHSSAMLGSSSLVTPYAAASQDALQLPDRILCSCALQGSCCLDMYQLWMCFRSCRSGAARRWPFPCRGGNAWCQHTC